MDHKHFEIPSHSSGCLVFGREGLSRRERLLFINDSALNIARKDALRFARRGWKEGAANSAGKSILLACLTVIIIAFCFLP